MNYYCVVNDVFSKEEVERIIDLEDLQKFARGTVGNQPNIVGDVNPNTRDCEVAWIHPDHRSEWLFQKFGQIVGEVNYDMFSFNINSFGAFQYTVYDKDQFYDWHVDEEAHWSDYTRKISATILLSNPSEYDGGEFEIIPYGMVSQPEVYKPDAGDILFFASYMPHRVRPVTRGVRKSLVSWILGPW